jgi:hypothetical protein
MLKGRLGLETARIPHVDRFGYGPSHPSGRPDGSSRVHNRGYQIP